MGCRRDGVRQYQLDVARRRKKLALGWLGARPWATARLGLPPARGKARRLWFWRPQQVCADAVLSSCPATPPGRASDAAAAPRQAGTAWLTSWMRPASPADRDRGPAGRQHEEWRYRGCPPSGAMVRPQGTADRCDRGRCPPGPRLPPAVPAALPPTLPRPMRRAGSGMATATCRPMAAADSGAYFRWLIEQGVSLLQVFAQGADGSLQDGAWAMRGVEGGLGKIPGGSGRAGFRRSGRRC